MLDAPVPAEGHHLDGHLGGWAFLWDTSGEDRLGALAAMAEAPETCHGNGKKRVLF